MITAKKYKSAWWSIELPANWEVDSEENSLPLQMKMASEYCKSVHIATIAKMSRMMTY